jgi:hypothetical protein
VRIRRLGPITSQVLLLVPLLIFLSRPRGGDILNSWGLVSDSVSGSTPLRQSGW